MDQDRIAGGLYWSPSQAAPMVCWKSNSEYPPPHRWTELNPNLLNDSKKVSKIFLPKHSLKQFDCVYAQHFGTFLSMSWFLQRVRSQVVLLSSAQGRWTVEPVLVAPVRVVARWQ